MRLTRSPRLSWQAPELAFLQLRRAFALDSVDSHILNLGNFDIRIISCTSPPKMVLSTLCTHTYRPDVDFPNGFAERLADRDDYVVAAAKVFTVHEQSASNLWSKQNASQQKMVWEPFTVDIMENHGTMVSKTTWRSHVMVWGRYELDVGDMLHFRIPGEQKVAMVGEVLGSGISGCKLPVETSDKPPLLHAKWDIRVPVDHEALIQLRHEVEEGEAWHHILKAFRDAPFEPRPLSEEDCKILKHLIIVHELNPQQAHAVRLVLDGAPILPVSGNAGSGKTQTTIACIKALIMLQGYRKAGKPNTGWSNTVDPILQPQNDCDPRAAILVTCPNNK